MKLPLVYYYALETPEGNTKLYKALVSRMAVAVSSRLSEGDESTLPLPPPSTNKANANTPRPPSGIIIDGENNRARLLDHRRRSVL